MNFMKFTRGIFVKFDNSRSTYIWSCSITKDREDLGVYLVLSTYKKYVFNSLVYFFFKHNQTKYFLFLKNIKSNQIKINLFKRFNSIFLFESFFIQSMNSSNRANRINCSYIKKNGI